MNVKILKMFLMLLSLLILTSCSKCKSEVKYVDKPYRVNVPVKCIVPDSNCSFDRKTDTEVISSMLECIIDMKHNEEKCK